MTFDDLDLCDRLVGFYDLKYLLRPPHPWFAPHEGRLMSLVAYQHHEGAKHRLLYPRIRAYGRYNPLRRKQLSRGHSARTIETLQSLMEASGLGTMRLTALVFTMPRHVSYRLCRLKDPVSAAWRLWSKIWKCLQFLSGEWSGIGALVNLHLWKTEDPTRPHVHFHVLIPDYLLSIDPATQLPLWRRQSWHRQPFSEDELDLLKRSWLAILQAWCRRRKLDSHFAKINVFCDWVDWATPVSGRPKFLHKINYQRRHWTEDYARYTIDNPEALDPPAWLVNYDNRGRVFGWWGYIAALLPKPLPLDKAKLSPLTGARMKYLGPWYLPFLLRDTGGRLGTLEISHGRVIYGDLSPPEVDWLFDVACPNWDGPRPYARSSE